MRYSRRRRERTPAGTRTFLLGAGCQKGGTTWVYRYLKGAPGFVHGYRKEYHVFDTVDLPEMAWMRRRTLDLAEAAVAAERRGEPARPDHLHRAAMCADPRHYYDYFAGLLHREGARLTADVTPDYALLSPERLGEVRSELGRRGVRTVAAFVMRDPVERTLSAIRMRKSRLPDQVPRSVPDALQQMYAQPAFSRRSDYVPTVRALDAAFGEDVFFGFYEELFTDAEVRRLCDAVGIGFRPPDYEVRPNATAADADPLPTHLVREVAEHHRPVYEFVAARFGRDLVDLWPSARHL